MTDLIDEAEIWADKYARGYPNHIVRRLIAALRQQETWSPIETAPKDGTPILAAVAGLQSLTIVGWHQDWDGNHCWGTYSDIEANQYFGDGFFTHWRRLPQSPLPASDGLANDHLPEPGETHRRPTDSSDVKL